MSRNSWLSAGRERWDASDPIGGRSLGCSICVFRSGHTHFRSVISGFAGRRRRLRKSSKKRICVPGVVPSILSDADKGSRHRFRLIHDTCRIRASAPPRWHRTEPGAPPRSATCPAPTIRIALSRTSGNWTIAQ